MAAFPCLAGCALEPLPAHPGRLSAAAPDPAAAAVDASSSWSAAAEAGIVAGEYAAEPAGEGFRATNRAQALRATFGAAGVAVVGRDGAGEVRLLLRAWGREDAMERADAVPPEGGGCLAGGAVDAFGACLRRVDYARPGLVEWWENRAEGLEQGFTVTAPPAGEGALGFALEVAGAEVEVGADGARLRRAGADVLRYAGLVAFDEAGRELPSWMEEDEGGLRLMVDDEGAVGTITVDPPLTTASWTAESDQEDAVLGSVVSAGDVNGDGYGDVVVGAPYYDNGETDEGRAYVYLGSATTVYGDADGDGHGSSAPPLTLAAGEATPPGYVANSTDCHDGAAAIHPGATEVCNGLDEDCDGSIDDEAVDATTWYADADGDGYTDLDAPLVACDEPDGYAAATEHDCDDEDVTSFPGASEVPDDGVDQDCDGGDLVTGETGSPADDTGGDDSGTGDDKGCGCEGGGRSVSLAALGLLALVTGWRRGAAR